MRICWLYSLCVVQYVLILYLIVGTLEREVEIASENWYVFKIR